MFFKEAENWTDNVILQQFLSPVTVQSVTLPLTLVTLLFATLIPIARFLFVRLIFRPLGRRFLPRPTANGSVTKVLSKKQSVSITLLEKWEMACWSFLFYFCATTFNFLVISKEHWFYKTPRLWYECSRIPCEYKNSSELLLIYALQLGYYLQAIPSMIIWDLKRKDFYQMLVHHIATIGLIAYSIRTNFVKAGALILILHDVCDVLMEAAKLCRYLEWNQASTVVFGVFVVVWILMRVIYLPACLIRSCMVDTLGFLAIPYDIPPEPHYIFLNGLLSLLFCIHLYWTFLILKIVWSVLVLNKEVDDVREEEEEEMKKEN